MGTVYIVGEKASFVHAGRMYKPGDEIKSDIFEKTGLETAIKSGKLLTKAQAEAKEKTTPSSNDKKSTEKTNTEGAK